MKPYIILFLIGTFLFSCQKQEEELTISPEILVRVLADIHIAEGAVLAIKPSHKDSIRDFYYDQIYEIHEIQANAFKHDIGILKQRPKMMEAIYEEVLKELDQRAKDLESNDKKDKKEEDKEVQKEKK